MDSLLNPRVIQLLDYPTAFYKKGHIFDCRTPTHRSQYHSIEWYRKYPEVFRELQWWEYRKEEDLSEYVLCLNLSRPNKPIHVKKYFLHLDSCLPYVLDIDDITTGYLHMCIPIIKEEYETYLAVSQKSV